MALKYLFTAEFEDGSVFEQPKDDKSRINEEKSSFYDLLEIKKRIRQFTLRNWWTSVAVDLIDGHFEVNGLPIQVGDALPIKSDLRLIFFRQHQHDYNPVLKKEIAHRVRYFIGWQTTINGKNFKRLIGID